MTTTSGEPSARPAVAHGLDVAARWAVRLLVLGVAAWAVLWLLGQGWSLVLPLILAVLLTAVLWPLARLLRRFLPHALAAVVSLLLLIGVIVGVFAVLVPNIADQGPQLVDSAGEGLTTLQGYVTGAPLNLGDDQIGSLIDRGVSELKTNAQAIALGVAGGLGTVGASIGSGVVTFVLVLVLSFFCLSDGDRLLPWSRRWLDARTHHHATELGSRIWKVLQGYIVSQAAVALCDAVFIGIGLRILGVPFALPLAVIIFFSSFIPIVGAVVSGILAVLVALVTVGWVQALIALGIVLLVQQLEGNVLQPLLVGRTLALHPVVVIGSVTVGGTAFGIIGAFLAVPVVAILTAVLRYVHHVQLPDEPENPRVDPPAKKPRRSSPAAGATAAGTAVPASQSAGGDPAPGHPEPGTTPTTTAVDDDGDTTSNNRRTT
ncbi:AI-2E family transporter [Kineococcus rubinsiae]|uniref:AI-2E family transporter n=1 Tax=Kineococcus rubinsiae TaxID=2609562 RepID=UPI00142FE7F7|nr:AI-2E family transporter [Kineococcus rubinsiae]